MESKDVLHLFLMVVLALATMACLQGCVIKIPITIEFPPKTVTDYFFANQKGK